MTDEHLRFLALDRGRAAPGRLGRPEREFGGLNDGNEPCSLRGPLFRCRAAFGGTAAEQGTAQVGHRLRLLGTDEK